MSVAIHLFHKASSTDQRKLSASSLSSSLISSTNSILNPILPRGIESSYSGPLTP